MTENLKKVLLLAGLSAGGGGGGGGTFDHSQLTNRGAANQHPMSAIEGLVAALAAKVNTSDYAPVPKTSAMTQAVGKGTDGKLYTTPGGGVDFLAVVNGEICVVYEMEDEE